jgi:hypothetical protein
MGLRAPPRGRPDALGEGNTVTPADVLNLAIRPANNLLALESPLAEVMLLAIGHQESRFTHRRQVGGPARGWWQFEVNGIRGVMTHRASRARALELLQAFGYLRPQHATIHGALEHNDVLSAGFARLLLYTLPQPLPTTPEDGWAQYLAAWRPGKPYRSTWARAWRVAIETITP